MRDFNDLLNEVLNQEMLGEPCPGMEQRILARVSQVQGKAVIRIPGWWMATAASLAACLVAGVFVHHRFRAAEIPSSPATLATPAQQSITSRRHETTIPPERKAVVLPQPRVWMKRRVDEHLDPSVMRGRQERLPKMETFPAVPHRGGDALAKSPKALQALQELKAMQEQPLQINGIEIQPL